VRFFVINVKFLNARNWLRVFGLTLPLLVVSFLPASLAGAADWSNGTIGCNVQVKSVGASFDLGVWSSLLVVFFVEAEPATNVEYSCQRDMQDSSRSRFHCTWLVDHKYQYSLGGKKSCDLILEPVKATQKGTCEKMFPLVDLSLTSN
jgi:hypothetical protein